jgi:hypothetical protein
MGLKYLWDTNTVIHYLQRQFPLAGEEFIEIPSININLLYQSSLKLNSYAGRRLLKVTKSL